jgi:Domain of unknown function (DUF1952)
MAEVVFGGVPVWLLEAYLVELGGSRAGEHLVDGDGWRATLKAQSGGAGHIGIARVTVTIEGERAAGVLAALRKKAQRGGG